MSIRLATPLDIEPCVLVDASNFHIYTDEKRRSHFREMIPKQAMLIFEEDEQILAYATYEPKWFECTFLKLVVVDAPARRRGLGSLLIQHIMGHCCPSGRLFSSTEDDNDPSKAMHEKLGFKVSGSLDNLPQPNREIFYFKRVK